MPPLALPHWQSASLPHFSPLVVAHPSPLPPATPASFRPAGSPRPSDAAEDARRHRLARRRSGGPGRTIVALRSAALTPSSRRRSHSDWGSAWPSRHRSAWRRGGRARAGRRRGDDGRSGQRRRGDAAAGMPRQPRRRASACPSVPPPPADDRPGAAVPGIDLLAAVAKDDARRGVEAGGDARGDVRVAAAATGSSLRVRRPAPDPSPPVDDWPGAEVPGIDLLAAAATNDARRGVETGGDARGDDRVAAAATGLALRLHLSTPAAGLDAAAPATALRIAPATEGMRLGASSTVRTTLGADSTGGARDGGATAGAAPPARPAATLGPGPCPPATSSRSTPPAPSAARRAVAVAGGPRASAARVVSVARGDAPARAASRARARPATGGKGGTREAATERMLCGDGMPRSAFARRCGPPSLGAAGAAFFHFFFYFFSCFFF